MTMARLLSIVGRKGSGKAEVLAQLISILSQKGFRVGVIKHMARPELEVDEPGTDTYRYRMEGAETVMLASEKRLALFQNLNEEIPIDELLVYFEGFDLIFLEGYFLEEIPKIEIYRKEAGELLLTHRVQNVLAICSDECSRRDVPCFSPTDLSLLASFIEDKLLKTNVGSIHE